MIALILTTVLLAQAPPQSDAQYCEKTWADETNPSAKESLACAEHWVDIAYGGKATDEDIQLDPYVSTTIALRYTTHQLLRMEKHIRQACKKCQTDRPGRAAEFLQRCAVAKMELFDSEIPDPAGDLRPMLKIVLAGKKLTKDDITRNAVTLWKARNAVFARHGRPFKNPDLNGFFYEGKHGGESDFLPLKKNPKYNDAMLTKIDKANIALIRSLEK